MMVGWGWGLEQMGMITMMLLMIPRMIPMMMPMMVMKNIVQLGKLWRLGGDFGSALQLSGSHPSSL